MKSVTLGPIAHLGEAVPLGKAASIGASTASHGEHRPPLPPEPTLRPSEAILARMDAEMPGLRDSLVCWYCPKLQLADDNMTPGEFNEILAEEYPQYDGGLRDLSGNGRDGQIFNMTGETNGGYISDEGILIFDGVDDDAIVEDLSCFGSDYTVFTDLDNAKTDSYCCSTSNTYERYPFRYSGRREGLSVIQTTGVTIEGAIPQGNISMRPGTWYLNVANLRKGAAYYASVSLRAIVIFKIATTTEQTDWVKANMINI